MHPQQISGFVELATHQWVTSVCQAVLGPKYEIVEIGFDVPFQGARYQPWHRDFFSPPETYEQRRLTSLAFNLTGVDVTEDMGPFEIARWPRPRHPLHNTLFLLQLYSEYAKTIPATLNEIVAFDVREPQRDWQLPGER